MFSKGQEVYQFHAWGRALDVSYRRLTITSWGKKWGTAIVNGRNVEERFYTQAVNNGYMSTCAGNHGTIIVPAANVADPDAMAVEFSRRLIAQESASAYRAGNQAAIDEYAALTPASAGERP